MIINNKILQMLNHNNNLQINIINNNLIQYDIEIIIMLKNKSQISNNQLYNIIHK
jgi:hypothetical protein